MDEREGLTKRQKTLAVVLRCFGCLDVLALVVVFLPQRWIETTAVSLGLTPFPRRVKNLNRSPRPVKYEFSTTDGRKI